MSMMRELKFFHGIQINQSKDGVYVHQTKYTKEILKKFKLEDCKVMNTPMHPTCTLSTEDNGSKVDQKLYRGMIDSFLYLTASRTERKSTSGNCQFLGENLISWASKRQETIVMSTAETEYISAASCCTQLLWMKH